MQVHKIRLTHDRPKQFPSFFVGGLQWNQTTMRWSRVSKVYHFLKRLANCVDSMLFDGFLWCLKLCFKIFRKRSHRIGSNFVLIEAIMAGKNSLERFLKKKLLVQRSTKINKKRNGVVRCHGDSDCNKTQIIRNVHLYIIHLW